MTTRRSPRSHAYVLALVLVAMLVPSIPAAAEGWPHVVRAYGRFDGTTFNDPIDQPAGNAIADISSGVTDASSGPLASTYLASDGATLTARFRLRTTPGNAADPSGWDTSKGGLTGFAYVVQLAVDGVHTASIGVDGKTSAADYVYVAPVAPITVGGVTYTDTNPLKVSTWDGTTIPGARVLDAGTAAAPDETYLDFQVPIADITTVAPNITAATPLQLFYGTSAAANLTTINKDYMSNAGTSCAQVGCATITLSDSTVGAGWSAGAPVPVSGPNPPQVGQVSAYDLPIEVTNTGANQLTATVTDVLPAHVTPVSVGATQGTATLDGQNLDWTVTLEPGVVATGTVRVSVQPDGSQHGAPVPLTDGVAVTGSDLLTGRQSSDDLPAVATAATEGGATSSDLAASLSGPTALTHGDTGSWTATASNLGPADPTDATLTVTAPASLDIEAVTAVDGLDNCGLDSSGVLTCDVSAASGTSQSVTFDGRAVADGDADLTATTAAAQDDNAGNDTAALATTVTGTPPPNRAPVATDDAATIREGTTARLDVLANDTDADGDTLTITAVSDPDHGTVALVDNEVAYTAPQQGARTVTLTYTVVDGRGGSATGTVEVTVERDPALAPVVRDDRAGGPVDDPVTVDVLANDEAAAGDPLDPATVAVATPPSSATIVDVDPSTGRITYQPDAGFDGTDAFTYEVCDGAGRCAIATVHLATPPIDLELSSERIDPFVNGNAVRYRIRVTNLGPRPAEGPLSLTVVVTGPLAGTALTGDGWASEESTEPLATRRARAATTPSVTHTLVRPAGLGVDEVSVLTLSGTVDGDEGATVRINAEVGGPFVEQVYANNADEATDTVQAAPEPDPSPSPTSPAPTGPSPTSSGTPTSPSPTATDADPAPSPSPTASPSPTDAPGPDREQEEAGARERTSTPTRDDGALASTGVPAVVLAATGGLSLLVGMVLLGTLRRRRRTVTGR